MAKRTVTFGMTWECYGQQTIELPENIDIEDADEIIHYIKSVWDTVPIPDAGEYISDSDDLDEESLFEINDGTGYAIQV